MLKSVKVVSFGLMLLLLIALMVSFIKDGSNAHATVSQMQSGKMQSGKTTVFWSTPTPTKNQTPTPTKNQTPTPTKHQTPTPTKHQTPTPTKHQTPTPTKHQTPTPSPTSPPPGPPGLPPTGSDPEP